MFTGIIQEIGKVKEIIRGKGYKLTITLPRIKNQKPIFKSKLANDYTNEKGLSATNYEIPIIDYFHEPIKLGESIAVDGVCLTVSGVNNPSLKMKNEAPVSRNQTFGNENVQCEFTVDIMEETVKRTTISEYLVGREVNIERAMTATNRFGGHFVNGHIDGVGVLIRAEIKPSSKILTFKVAKELLPYVVEKGSIAIDGVSLTVISVKESSNQFSVSLVPFTIENTTLGKKKISDKVNIEVDIIGKYVIEYLERYKKF